MPRSLPAALPAPVLAALAALVLLAAPAAGAQGARVDPSLAADHVGGVHVVTARPDGTLACDLATEAQLARSRAVEAAPVRLTPLPPLREETGGAQAREVSPFRIVLRATDQLIERPQALLAFRRAAARWERVIRSPLTVVIDVDYGPLRFGGGEYAPGVIASANSALQFYGGGAGSAEVVAQLRGRNTGDAQLQALYAAIPVPTPSTFPDGNGGQNLGAAIGGLIPLQALGVRPARTDPDPAVNPFGRVPNIGFNSAFNYDFDPNDGIGAQQTDFEAVVAHEIGHALAFTSAVGFTQAPPFFTPWDLFRVRPEAVTPGESLTDGAGWETALRVVTPGPANTEVIAVEGGRNYFAPVQVTFDGNAEYETSTATGGRAGGDGQQASHWRDDALRPPSLGAARKIGIMDPTIGRGERIDLSFADVRLLQLIGFTVDFDPPTATLVLAVGGRTIDEALVVPEVSLGDVAVGATREVAVSVQNASADNALEFEVEVVVDAAFPAGIQPTVALAQASGTVGPSGEASVALRVGGVDGPAFVAGRLRVRSNDAARAFVEVPFTFSVGGATEPRLAVTAPASVDLGDIDRDQTKTFEIALENTGSLPLGYRLAVALAARQFDLSSSLPASPEALRRAPLFAADFDGADGLGPFTFEGDGAPDTWRVTPGGRATLGGHSGPNAAYFGLADGSAFRYSNNSFGQLVTPGLDVSALDAGDVVRVSFHYFLKAEAGLDVASVLVSVDGGASYDVVATSAGGVLQNTVGPTGDDPRWETVAVDVPGAAGRTTPVRVAFRFESDSGVTDEGWYLDDVVVEGIEGGAGLFASPLDGTLAGGESQTVVVTARGADLAPGFYRGSVEAQPDQRLDGPDPIQVSFSVGDPSFPTVAAVDAQPTFSVEPDALTPVTLAVRNGGDALLSFVRVLEPAASDYDAPAALAPSPEALAQLGRPVTGEVGPAPAGASLAASASGSAARFLAALPGAALPGDLTQLPDGRVLVLDIGIGSAGAGTYGQTFLLPADLSDVTVIPSPDVITTQVTGLAYNDRTGTLWMTELATGLLREFRLDEAGAAPRLVPTETVVELGLATVGLAYSPELDALFTSPFQSDVLLALTVTGDVLSGYPVLSAAGGNVLPGLSVTGGVLEVGTADLVLTQVGQFGRPFEGAQTTTVTAASVGGATRVNGYLRSRIDPDGTAYVVSGAGIFAIDPPDLPAAFSSRILAAEPLFADQSVEAREAFALDLVIDSRGLDAGATDETLAFLTNDPARPLVRIPVRIVVGSVAGEPAPASAFVLRAPVPNPARSTAAVRFELAAPSEVTVEVYNTLGRRVATLMSGAALAAGPHDVALDAGALAAGVYVVRVVAGGAVGTQKLTVVR